MTAPERIWATEDAANFGQDRFHTTRQMSGLTEYIRADLVQEIVAEAVKAEREALQSMAKDRASSLKDVCRGWDSDKGKASFTGGAIELVAFAAAIRARGEG